MKPQYKLTFAVLSCLALAAVSAPATGQVPTLELPPDAGAVVVEYTLVHHMLEERDPEPLLRIYADGRVRVHHPVYMAKAGDYEGRLSAAELRSLLFELIGDGVLDFDEAGTIAERASAVATERAAGQFHHVSDVTESVLDIRVASYRAAGAAVPTPDFQKRIRWPNVYIEAQRFGEIAGLQALARSSERLQSIINRSDLARVR